MNEKNVHKEKKVWLAVQKEKEPSANTHITDFKFCYCYCCFRLQKGERKTKIAKKNFK